MDKPYGIWKLLSCVRLSAIPWSVHGILHARIMDWVAIPFSRVSSPPRDQTQVSCTAGRFFPIWATRGSLIYELYLNSVLSQLPLLKQTNSMHVCARAHTHTHTHTHTNTFRSISAKEPIICRAPSFFRGSAFGSVRIW